MATTRSRFEVKVLAAFTAAALVAVGLAASVWKVAQDAAAATQWVAHTHEVIDALARARTDTLQIEFSTQGYRISGDPARLAERDATIAARETTLIRIKQLTRDNASQQTRWQRLREVLDERLQISARVEQLRRTQGLEAASAFVSSSTLQETRERTYRLLREMDEEERRLLAQRHDEQLRAGQRMAGAGALATLLLLTLLATSYLLIRRQLRETEASQHALANSEESLATTLQSIGDAVLATDTQGRITRMNNMGERLTGWPLAEALGRPIAEVFRILNEVTREPAPIPVDDVLRTGQIHGLANHTVLIARDGSEHAIADSAAPIRNTWGQLQGVVLVFRDVSQERTAELALQASEARYRQFIEESPFGVFVQCDGRFVFLNPKAVALLGAPSQAELLGRAVIDFLHPDSREAVAKRIRQLNEEGVAAPALEGKWLRVDGSAFHGEATGAPYTHEGRPGALVLLQDISARKEAEEQLDRFFNISLDMLCIASADGYFKRVSPAFTQTLGWSAKEMLATPYAELVHPDDWAATLAEVQRQVVDGEMVLHFENRYRHKDGGWRMLSWKSVPQEGGLMFATARDVTEHHAAEIEIRLLNTDLQRNVEERSAALNALRKREEEIRALVDNMLDCVVTIDAHGIVHSANPALQRVLGYSAAETVGQNVSMLMPEPHNQEHDTYLAHYLQTGEAHIIGVGREVDGRHKDGRLIPLELAISEFTVKDEHLFIGTLRDISERKRFIAELRQARTEAEQANRAKSAFLATMSHEIRTPMNGVIGMVDVLAHGSLSPHQKELVTTIRESASALLGIIDDILDFSKIEAGRLEIERAPLSVADLVEGVCNSLLPVAARRGVELALFISPDIPERVLSDDVRLRQVLYNLVGNAIKFSGGRPEVRGRVAIRAEVVQAAPLRLMLRVADNGIGMAADTLHNLFTPFTQAEVSTTRRFGGTGLGLAICKRLVDLMGGEMQVHATLGVGSTFAVTLPLETAREQPTRVLPDISDVDCIMVKGGDIAVEDMRVYLEHAGARLHVVADAAAASEFSANFGAPVVIVQDAGSERPAVEEAWSASAELPHVHLLLITRGRRQRGRLANSKVVTLDGNALRRQALLRAVAVAAGRASPEIFSADAGGHPVEAEAAAPSAAQARARGQLILVAEDDAINQKVIRQQLALLGYAAEIANNGTAALKLWRQGHFALLLTDLHMPEMDGYSLATAIRGEEEGRARMPILALTANALRGEASRAKAAGMDEYLTKPVQLQRLRTALEKWLPPAQQASSVAAGPSQARTDGNTGASGPVDVAVLEALVGSDAQTVREFLTSFLASARRLAQELRTAVAGGDALAVAAAAHKLKSSARMVGAFSVANLCAQLEQAGKTGNHGAIERGMPSFDSALAQVESHLDASLTEGN